ncbi:MAG: VWA domain-containing protein [Actinomycetota bacterium]|nr:VWA domain-containing protein [Actinomycetota bacterium]
MKRTLPAAFLVALLALVVTVPAAGAAEGINIRKVDTTAFPKVTIAAQVVGPTPDLGSFALRENGRILTDFDVVPIAKTDTPVGIVLVIDTSGSMRPGGKMEAAKEAARQFVAQKQPNDQLAVVAFSSEPRVVAGFTNDAGRLTEVINGLVATGETALFDAVRTGATLLTERPELQPNIVLLSDGADTTSQNGVAEAEAAVLSAKAVLFAVGLRGGEFDAASLDRLSRASGGQYSETTDPGALKGIYANVQRVLQNQYEISYTSSAQGSIEISLAVAGLRTTATANAGTVSQGIATQPQVVPESRFADLFSGPGVLLIVLLVALAAAFLVGGVVAIARRDGGGLDDTLAVYGPSAGAVEVVGDRELAQTAVVKRAVAATARFADERGLLDKVEAKLEQADLPVRPAEALFFYVVALVVGAVLGLALKGVFGAALALIVVGLGPLAVVNAMATRRQRKFTAQLPDMLQLWASTLRAGFSLLQGADAVADQVDDPMGKELRRVLVEARLGRPLELALEDSARRVNSEDFDWTVMAIKIQREVGGNLAELLDTVADTMVARERLRRDVRTLTAEGRISAIVLGILPVAIGAAVYVLNPGYLDPLFQRTVGQIMLVGGILMGIAGFAWMKKIINIET